MSGQMFSSIRDTDGVLPSHSTSRKIFAVHRLRVVPLFCLFALGPFSQGEGLEAQEPGGYGTHSCNIRPASGRKTGDGYMHRKTSQQYVGCPRTKSPTYSLSHRPSPLRSSFPSSRTVSSPTLSLTWRTTVKKYSRRSSVATTTGTPTKPQPRSSGGR